MSQSYPLSMSSLQETVSIVAFDGGKNMQIKLQDLGLALGASVKVLQHGGGNGPMLLAVGDARIAVGRSMSHKIMVSPQKAK